MGYYTEYLNKGWDYQGLAKERKEQLKKISQLRKRDVLVFAADLNKPIPQLVSITYSDLLPIHDQISGLKGDKIDFILETPGGSGEVAEDIVRLLRSRYNDVAVIIPGWAKSAGTIMAMAADELLMDPAVSSLGPIDAQLSWQGKVFSADAFLEGIDKIKKEIEETGSLNKAYIPILQGISPGEIQSAENALNFAKELVAQWLEEYKFKNWTIHSTSKKAVTLIEKKERAREIAKKLCDHRHWLTHGRSIKLKDLEAMKLKVADYSINPPLAEAINRYYTLLQMSFAGGLYKLFETPETQIQRLIQGPGSGNLPTKALNSAIVDLTCNKCNAKFKIQANFEPSVPIENGAVPFPASMKFQCPNCKFQHDLGTIKKQLEAQAGRKIIV